MTLRLLHGGTITATVEGTCLYWPIPPRWGSTAELDQNRTVRNEGERKLLRAFGSGDYCRLASSVPRDDSAAVAGGRVHSVFWGKFRLFGLFLWASGVSSKSLFTSHLTTLFFLFLFYLKGPWFELGLLLGDSRLVASWRKSLASLAVNSQISVCGWRGFS